jgi:tRNA threonylcarbamoyladenosine biosynthesis protein TsaB
MIILATDTSGKLGSIALARVDQEEPAKDSVEILEIVPLEGGTFSAQLIPQVSALLSRHGMSTGDLGAFAVASGPGSFTGLRVGLAAIKALAEVLRRPIVAVSMLEALAKSSSQRDVIAALDAGRGEVYIGEYEIADRVVLRGERLISHQELLSGAFSALVTPDAGIAEAAHKAGLPAELVAYPGSAAVARIGWEKLRLGATIAPDELEANYIRRSDAEIFAKQK